MKGGQERSYRRCLAWGLTNDLPGIGFAWGDFWGRRKLFLCS